MGSMTSRSKVPAAAAVQTVYVPVAAPSAAAAVAAPVPTQAASSGTSTDEAASNGATAETVRQASLLERGRGRLSTILTSFKGVLNDTGATSRQKTLLGE